MSGRLSVTAIIVNYESGDRLDRCIRSLYDDDPDIEIVVVDNGSTDGSVDAAVRRYPDVLAVRSGNNTGFAGGANRGAEDAHGEVLLFLNPDIEVRAGSVAALTDALADPTVGVVGPMTDTLASETVEFGATVDPLGSPFILTAPKTPLYVPGCALATRASSFRALGGFDERYFMFVEDVDYCWRCLLRGLDVRVVRAAFAVHEGGASAPGGYATKIGLQTTVFRVALRERNTLATIIKCYGALPAVLASTLYIGASVATAGVLALAGNRRAGLAILDGLAWNARHFGDTLARRRVTQQARVVPDRVIWARMHHGLVKLELLRRYGIPRVDESGRLEPSSFGR